MRKNCNVGRESLFKPTQTADREAQGHADHDRPCKSDGDSLEAGRHMHQQLIAGDEGGQGFQCALRGELCGHRIVAREQRDGQPPERQRGGQARDAERDTAPMRGRRCPAPRGRRSLTD
ncbi:hypothetical protein QFZ99_005020 [Paraburkholderia atlantica]